MQVQRVRVVRAVAKRKPVTRPLFEHEFPIMGIGFAVHGKAIEFAGAVGTSCR
jgi:hypothetical protein